MYIGATSLLLAAMLVCAQPSPPPGKLVDVGGYRVHLHCAGQGGPAVVILGDGFSSDWSLVAPAHLAEDARMYLRCCRHGLERSSFLAPIDLHFTHE